MYRISNQNDKGIETSKFKASCRLQTYTALIGLMLAFNVNAVTGIGEYRFGPDTAENVACEFAEERAKEDALIKFVGEYVDSAIQEVCLSEDCKFNRQTYNKIEGNIKSISNVKKFIKTEQGYKTCIVTVNADVERFKNNIEFLIDGKFDLKDGEIVQFTGSSNQFGAVYMFNYYGGKYVRVVQQKVATKWQKFVLPSEPYRIKAQVPQGQVQSKELLLFLFVTNNVSIKESYSDAEMKSVISQIPANERKVIIRHINIMR
jgi:hypothetical protein